MIKRIEHFGLELHGQPLVDLIIPDHREVPSRCAVRADTAESDGKRAEIVRELLRRVFVEARIRVEPASHRLLAVRKLDVLDVARENIITPGERRT